MNFDRLRTFRALSESLHFRKTADKLHISQSAVSQQISALEDELGVMLLERIGRRTFLTPAGKVLVDEAGKVLQPSSVRGRRCAHLARGTSTVSGWERARHPASISSPPRWARSARPFHW